jgi:hypothetical protein
MKTTHFRSPNNAIHLSRLQTISSYLCGSMRPGDGKRLGSMNTVNLHLERLRRHYEVAVRTYDHLITQLAPWQPTRGNRVVHRYQPGHGPQCDPVPERPLPA